ncbi:MAG: cation:dicarboxylase symporter family transporter, partial [Candidatus Sericytochromatia bacterium]|nr:cation:dicarboxylase symporter family transporter [Candidatus Sericytochromatia bacterium]
MRRPMAEALTLPVPFNNDGLMLYEAMATLFLCQALGMDLSLADQLGVVAASVMAGVGIAGIP